MKGNVQRKRKPRKLEEQKSKGMRGKITKNAKENSELWPVNTDGR